MAKNQEYRLVLIVSLVVACVGWFAPIHRMPLDYDAMISKSIPLAIAWSVLLGFGLSRYEKRGLLLTVGAPLALYWPIWLLFNHFPSCYYLHNCM